MSSKIYYILLSLWLLSSCVEDDPPEIIDFDITIAQNTRYVIEGSGFDDGVEPIDEDDLLANYHEETDVITIWFSHEGNLQTTVPISITVSGNAQEGTDYPNLPEVFIYNPFNSSDENQISFQIADDLEFEPENETLFIEFSYDVNGEVKSKTQEIIIIDNDFRFELTWDSELSSSTAAEMDMGVRRNNGLIFFDLGRGTKISDNQIVYDLSGNIFKWIPGTGYGCDIIYVNGTENTGRVFYTAKLYLPDGQEISYNGSFENTDYLSAETASQLPFVVQGSYFRYSLSRLEILTLNKDGIEDYYIIDLSSKY